LNIDRQNTLLIFLRAAIVGKQIAAIDEVTFEASLIVPVGLSLFADIARCPAAYCRRILADEVSVLYLKALEQFGITDRHMIDRSVYEGLVDGNTLGRIRCVDGGHFSRSPDVGKAVNQQTTAIEGCRDCDPFSGICRLYAAIAVASIMT